MDAQNQNHVQPDYNFILNQGEKPQGTPAKPTDNKRKLLIIGGGLFIFTLLVIAAIVAAVSSNTQNVTTSGPVDAVEQYLTKVAAKDYENAYALLSATTTPNKAYYIEKSAPQFNDVFAVESCTLSDTVEKSGTATRLTVTCPYDVDSAKTATFLFTVDKQGDQEKIIGYVPKIDA